MPQGWDRVVTVVEVTKHLVAVYGEMEYNGKTTGSVTWLLPNQVGRTLKPSTPKKGQQ